jgi:hypothetical protein
MFKLKWFFHVTIPRLFWEWLGKIVLHNRDAWQRRLIWYREHSPLLILPDVKPTKHGYKNARGAIPWHEGDELAEVTIRRLRDGAPKETCMFTRDTCPYIKLWQPADEGMGRNYATEAKP